MLAKRYFAGGRVQGVGFRYFVLRAAQELGVQGWARNLADGRVEVLAQAPPEILSDFEARLRQGPPRSEVRTFEAREESPSKLSGFSIR